MEKIKGAIEQLKTQMRDPKDQEVQEALDISLYVAIEEGDLKAVNAAIESGANVNAQGCVSNKKGCRFITSFSPLASVYHATLRHRQVFSKSKRDKLIDIDTCFSLSDSLIAAGADTKPLLCNVIGRDIKWAYYLLNKTKDLSGLLHKAKDSSMISSLLKRGVDVNEILCGNSPLHEAVKRDDLQVIKELLKAGASLTQKNQANLTAFDIALENNHLKLATYLNSQLYHSSHFASGKFHNGKPSREDLVHFVQVDISNQLFRIANFIEIYLYANVLQDEEDEEDREDEDYE